MTTCHVQRATFPIIQVSAKDNATQGVVMQVADQMHRVVQLRMRVQGPPQPHWVTHTARDTKLLREALSVVEFAAVMQPVLLGEPVVLQSLLSAVHQPASSQVLPELYATLLRSCLLEVVHLEAPCVLFLPCSRFPFL